MSGAPPTSEGLRSDVPESSQPAPDDGNEDLDSGGGVDGPVMYWRERPPGQTEAEAAEMGGTLAREGNCLFLERDGYRSTVLWEFGTRWIEARSVVHLPDGTGIPVGSELPARAGGEHPPDQLSNFTTAETVIERARECAGPGGGVSVIQD